jgi:RNA 2',3'-cyclic 3'-phosphodiesterase
MPRLFVAFDLPEEQREHLEDLCDDLPEARWTPYDQLHVTLAFLGEVDGGRARDAAEALADVVAPPFELVLQGVGHFPPRGEPRIVWAGFAPSEELLRLQRGIVRALKDAGCEIETRKFHPHVTLGRLHAAPPERVAAWLTDRGAFSSGPFPVTEFLLYSSVLGREGATHHIEQEYPLG